jgi:DNA-binding GntR family transcriptional regulator
MTDLTPARSTSDARKKRERRSSDRVTSFVQPITAKHRTLESQAVAEIQRRILSGELQPGQRLRIEELAEMLEMSPMPVRDALHRLEALGFTDRIPHRGTRVRPLSSEDLIDLYAARIPLEMLAVRRAAERFTPEAAEHALGLLETYRSLYELDPPSARETHLQFHFSLYAAGGSPWLMRLIRPLVESSERYRVLSLPSRGTIEERHREHLAILNACAAHEPEEAAIALREHLSATIKALAAQLSFDMPPELSQVELATYLDLAQYEGHNTVEVGT